MKRIRANKYLKDQDVGCLKNLFALFPLNLRGKMPSRQLVNQCEPCKRRLSQGLRPRAKEEEMVPMDSRVHACACLNHKSRRRKSPYLRLDGAARSKVTYIRGAHEQGIKREQQYVETQEVGRG